MAKRVKSAEIRKQRGNTDWNHLKKNYDGPVADPHASELSPAQLGQMK